MFAAVNVVTAWARSGWARDIDVRVVADTGVGLFLIGDGYGPTYGGYHFPLALDPCIDAIQTTLKQPHSRNVRSALDAANDVAAEYLTKYGPTNNRQALIAAADGAGAREWARIQDRSWGLYHCAAGISLTLMVDDALHVAQIGLSRVYLRRAGQIRLLLLDHSLPSQVDKFRHDFPPDHPLDLESMRTVVTRVLGIVPKVEIDYAVEPLRNADEVLICSSGIWNHRQGEDTVRALFEAPAEVIAEIATKTAVKSSRLDSAVVRFQVQSTTPPQ